MPTTMRAIIIKDGKGPVENLHLGEIEKPVPRSDEVQVKIIAFGLNRMDITQREGNYPLPPHAPPTLGVEFSGHISEVGQDVKQWKIGEEVLGLAVGGAYAEYISLPATHVMKKPSQLNWVEAASIPEVYLTAYQGLIKIGGLKEGEDTLIHAAASGVGIAAIELAKFYKARHIIATASTQEKLDWVLNDGATHGINYKTQDFSAEVKKITEGKGVNVVLDFVGADYWDKNIKSLAIDGRMTLLALMGGEVVASADLNPVLYRRLKIQGSTLRSRPISYQAQLISEFDRDILQHISGSTGDSPMKAHIHKVYPWTEIQDAHRYLAANKNIGKIVIEVV